MRRCESGEGTPHSNTQLQAADICLTFLAALVKSPGILRWQRRDFWFSSIREALKELQVERMRPVTLVLPNNQNHRLASKVFFLPLNVCSCMSLCIIPLLPAQLYA
ncbi:hypothetical protein BJX65DRAFT_73478 [Aspergillus insuetus]